MFRYLTIILLLLVLSCNKVPNSDVIDQREQNCLTKLNSIGVPPKNIILVIGDGMGQEYIDAANYYYFGSLTNFAFEQLPYQGQVETFSATSTYTDSAAAATAMATGVKVKIGVISQNIPGNGCNLKIVTEFLKEQGKSTGIITTTDINDATPAAFISHALRPEKNIITAQMLTSTHDLIFGISPLKAASNCQVITNKGELASLPSKEYSGRVCGFFGDGTEKYEHDGLGDIPHLKDMTTFALDYLSSTSTGFFLLVEGALIDHAGHANDIERALMEVYQLSKTIDYILEWIEDNPDTLLVITADHETGGLKTLYNNGAGNLPEVSWQTTRHTTTPVPIFAIGPNAEQVSSFQDNTQIFTILSQLQR